MKVPALVGVLLSIALSGGNAQSGSKRILVYGPSLNTGAQNEQTIAQAAGHTVTVADATTWASMTATQFSNYHLIVFGDKCNRSDFAAAGQNKSTWSPVITGLQVIHSLHVVGHQQTQGLRLIRNAIDYASSGVGTGLFVGLECSFSGAPAGTPVSFLSEVGDFRTGPTSADQIDIVDSTHPVVEGLSDAGLSNWGNSVHEWLHTFPTTLKVLTLERSSDPAGRAVVIATPPVGLIAYDVKPVGGQTDIALYNRVTASLQTLPGLNSASATDRRPSISADGKLLAFASSRIGNGDIFLYDRPSASFESLPGLNATGSLEGSPSLSASGNWLAFDSNRTGVQNVYLYDLARKSLVGLPGLNTTGFAERVPALAASGRFIAFVSDRTGNGDIYLYDRVPLSLVTLPGLNGAFVEGSPALSGDGRLIVFSSTRKGAGDVFLYDRATFSFIALPGLNTSTSFDGFPAISADGRYILFTSNRSGNYNIYLYDRTTAGLVALPGLNTSGLESRPSSR